MPPLLCMWILPSMLSLHKSIPIPVQNCTCTSGHSAPMTSTSPSHSTTLIMATTDSTQTLMLAGRGGPKIARDTQQDQAGQRKCRQVRSAETRFRTRHISVHFLQGF